MTLMAATIAMCLGSKSVSHMSDFNQHLKMDISTYKSINFTELYMQDASLLSFLMILWQRAHSTLVALLSKSIMRKQNTILIDHFQAKII